MTSLTTLLWLKTSNMASLTELLWCHLMFYYDVIYMSLTLLLCCLLPSYNVTMTWITTLTHILWWHLPHYLFYYDVNFFLWYNVTNLATITSLTLLLWRHWPHYYNVANLATMTFTLLIKPLYFDVISSPALITSYPGIVTLFLRHVDVISSLEIRRVLFRS